MKRSDKWSPSDDKFNVCGLCGLNRLVESRWTRQVEQKKDHRNEKKRTRRSTVSREAVASRLVLSFDCSCVVVTQTPISSNGDDYDDDDHHHHRLASTLALSQCFSIVASIWFDWQASPQTITFIATFSKRNDKKPWFTSICRHIDQEYFDRFRSTNARKQTSGLVNVNSIEAKQSMIDRSILFFVHVANR